MEHLETNWNHLKLLTFIEKPAETTQYFLKRNWN